MARLEEAQKELRVRDEHASPHRLTTNTSNEQALLRSVESTARSGGDAIGKYGLGQDRET